MNKWNFCPSRNEWDIGLISMRQQPIIKGMQNTYNQRGQHTDFNDEPRLTPCGKAQMTPRKRCKR